MFRGLLSHILRIMIDSTFMWSLRIGARVELAQERPCELTFDTLYTTHLTSVSNLPANIITNCLITDIKLECLSNAILHKKNSADATKSLSFVSVHGFMIMHWGCITSLLLRLPKLPSPFELHWLGNLDNISSNKENFDTAWVVCPLT